MTWGKEWPNGSKITFAGVKEPIKSLENIDIVWIDPINDLVSRTIIDSDKETVTIREIYKSVQAEVLKDAVLVGVDLGSNEQVIWTEYKNGRIIQTDITKEYNNKVPTHDPYTNPDAHIYYQCNCGAVLDPGTKSFAALNNAAMVSGWKIRFGHEYYVPYCVKCGEDVE